MLGQEDHAVLADSQPPVVAACPRRNLSGWRCGALRILLDLGDDTLPILFSEAAHIRNRPCTPLDS